MIDWQSKMKPTPPNHDDPPLSGLLQEWRVNATVPPRFQERVWKRIALEDTPLPARRGLSLWVGPVLSWLARPGLAAGYVCVLLAVGLSLGWTRGVERSEHVDETLSTRYVQVMDPYQGLKH
jgi:hypothetical protein